MPRCRLNFKTKTRGKSGASWTASSQRMICEAVCEHGRARHSVRAIQSPYPGSRRARSDAPYLLQIGMTPEIAIEKFEVFARDVDHSECIAFDRDGNLWAGGEGGQVYCITPD